MPFQDHVAGTIEYHPLGTIDFREFLDVPRAFRPLHGECVAMKPSRFVVTFDRIGRYDLAARLPALAQRQHVTRGWRRTHLLLEFPEGGSGRLLALLVLTLGN